MNNKSILKIIILSALVGALTGAFVVAILKSPKDTSEHLLIRDYYLTENAVHASPHSLRKRMDKGEDNYILVDLRSREEYEKEHIATAVNIPAYKDPNTSISLEKDTNEKERIISEFKRLPTNKEIIVYCYSLPCMTGRKVGKLLSENDIYVKHLGIGWNEWRYYWNLWNHDTEAPSKVEDYVVSGKEPGLPKSKLVPSGCQEGELSC